MIIGGVDVDFSSGGCVAVGDIDVAVEGIGVGLTSGVGVLHATKIKILNIKTIAVMIIFD
jgi:hypothetical protein